MLKYAGDTGGAGFYFIGIEPFKVLINRGGEQGKPLLEVSCPDSEVFVFLKRVAIVGLVSKNNGAPEIIHHRQMMGPVDMKKNGAELLISPNPFIKGINQKNNIFSFENICHGARYRLPAYFLSGGSKTPSIT